MRHITFVLSLALTFGVISSAHAQGRGNGGAVQNRTLPDAAQSRGGIGSASARSRDRNVDARAVGIPPGHMPPPGMCRIWVDGIPPGRQPRPTDCATARRNKPHNARVIYGGDTRYDDRDRERDRDRSRDRDRRDCAVWDWTCRDRRDDDDRRRRDDDYCRDANRDGRCDYRSGNGTGDYDSRNRPRTLPAMIGAVMMERGIRSPEVTRWLGTQRLTARYADTGRNRVPDRVTWLDAAGRVVQIWIDTDRDGRADRIEVFRDGRRVDVIR